LGVPYRIKLLGGLINGLMERGVLERGLIGEGAY
jgi:hypothetical protein